MATVVSEDPHVQKLSEDLVHTIRETFHTPENYRPVHAKGQLVKGTFTPSKDATKLSKAEIFTRASTPMILRYSTSPGVYNFPDNGEDGSRGFAMRFIISDDGKDFDIITNNGFGFITGTGEGFLEQFQAIKNNEFDKYLDKYPHAKYFQENQSPSHAISFASELWHSVQAFKFINSEGKERYFRWRVVPWQGVMKYSQADAKKQSKHFHFDDLEWRLTHNRPIKYRLMAQLAEANDPTNDSTKTWPETNEFAEMGEIVIDRLWNLDEGQPAGEAQKKIFFDPLPRHMDGIEASDDPLLLLRETTYTLSAKIRREHVNEKIQQATDLKE